MTDRILTAIINNQVALIVSIICITVLMVYFRAQVSPVIVAGLKIFVGKNFAETYAAEKGKKSAKQKPQQQTTHEHGLDVICETHSYEINRGWGQDEDSVFLQVDSIISECRDKRWKCAFDFSGTTVMNRQSHDGLIKAIRKALEDNSIGITIVFPKNIETLGQVEESRERFFRKCFDTLASECRSSTTISVKKNTRAEMRMVTNINIDYLTPADCKPKPEKIKDDCG